MFSSLRWRASALRMWMACCGIALVPFIYAVSPPASLADDSDAEGEKIAVAITAAEFEFKTTIKDDGTGDAGGWQEARARLTIGDKRPVMFAGWDCEVKVGMPLRTAAHGRISADEAAKVSAKVATKAVRTLMPEQPPGKWPPGVFCTKLVPGISNLFANDPYKRYGARATTWN